MPVISKKPLHVLFIGNSQTSVYNVPEMIKVMSESAPVEVPRIKIGTALIGGSSLKKSWEAGEAPDTPRGMIAAGKWDYVVIQEIYCNPRGEELFIEEFETYAALFDKAIRKVGAKTILFATASVTNLYLESSPPYPENFRILNDMQIAFGQKNGLAVASAGYAWIKYLGLNPSDEQLFDLYHEDKGHPGYKGSYIYACLLYSVITGKRPAGLTSEFKICKDDIVIVKDEAAKMQEAAWEQYLENCLR